MNNITSLELNKPQRTYFENETEMRGFIKGLNQVLRGYAQDVEVLKVDMSNRRAGLIRLTYKVYSDY